jgi:hypothetical protein
MSLTKTIGITGLAGAGKSYAATCFKRKLNRLPRPSAGTARKTPGGASCFRTLDPLAASTTGNAGLT